MSTLSIALMGIVTALVVFLLAVELDLADAPAPEDAESERSAGR